MAALRLLVVVTYFATPLAWGDTPTIEGVWRTYVEGTDTVRAWVRIQRDGGVYQGQLVRLFRRAEDPPEARCRSCPGALHDQPLLGMTILRQIEQLSADRYGGGLILDPENGQEYRCEITLQASGDVLEVRGYIGMPLFGRTQVWRRVVE